MAQRIACPRNIILVRNYDIVRCVRYTYYQILSQYVCIHILAIDRVTEVTLTCKPVELDNQCTVMWNVSVHKPYYEYVHNIMCKLNTL